MTPTWSRHRGRHIVVMGETCYDDCLIITPEEEGLETVSVETLVVPDY